MEIKRIDHMSGKGEYVVISRFGPRVSVTRFGPASLKECERYILDNTVTAIDVTETTFGTVRREAGSTTITADGDTLKDWAQRGDNRWPCSALADLDSIEVVYDSRGDLIELRGDEDADLACNELDAWASETLIRAGYPNHPAIRGNEVAAQRER